ncbi:hypothetical protein BDK51DRAFT_48721 [Blyttiomyces helicus]|uniref:Uncharacterized protein n=1 Tax=Blyttiomyces helicus TaxID=388810 RepID=A0A4P9VWA4_9FUNG|nr:hypothetical protein BDK51DRAFT_48721 [Blyttiomyces helicus]|eukprot:RKO82953.1 hypothetical protein BDK51DRAFT_48721 [Blyttiomyces helicus]
MDLVGYSGQDVVSGHPLSSSSICAVESYNKIVGTLSATGTGHTSSKSHCWSAPGIPLPESHNYSRPTPKKASPTDQKSAVGAKPFSHASQLKICKPKPRHDQHAVQTHVRHPKRSKPGNTLSTASAPGLLASTKMSTAYKASAQPATQRPLEWIATYDVAPFFAFAAHLQNVGLEPQPWEQVLTSLNNQFLVVAHCEQIQSLIDNEVFEIIHTKEAEGEAIITPKMIYRHKFDPDGTIAKYSQLWAFL